ncbi:MAG: FkbM family methyltransferase, partial [Caldilineaceae bacterium]|nr:FkbM family methyltransferase [Caldilineaceae bacterium]
DFQEGFFIEAGANDGIMQSNTLYFERYKKWQGLLIEPLPELAEKCKQNRPACIVENVALTAFDYPKNTIDIHYGGLMSLVRGARSSAEEELEHIHKGLDIQELSSTYTIAVPTMTLSDLLVKHRIQKVDLLSLDVEGYELQVLKGLDFKRHRPKFMLIEVRDRQTIEKYLAPFYELVDTLHQADTYADILFKARKGLE